MERSGKVVAAGDVGEMEGEKRVSKRMRKARCMSCCTSPRRLPPPPSFTWYEEDIWTEIGKFLDGKSLVMLGSANRWFHKVIMEDSVWKYACLRDLNVPAPVRVDFKWATLYASAFDGSHSYCFRQNEKHIDWMRIGAFFFDSPVAYLTEHLSQPIKIPREQPTREMVEKNGACILKNIKTGIWIADLQLVRCPVCNLDTCEGNYRLTSNHASVPVVISDHNPYAGYGEPGTMQMLDARHFELFLREEFKNNSWDYEEIGSRKSQKKCNSATAGIFDVKYIKTPSASQLLNLKEWSGSPTDCQPKSRINLHAVAVNTNLQQNDGLYLKYQVMKNGANGEVVSIRISQQLI